MSSFNVLRRKLLSSMLVLSLLFTVAVTMSATVSAAEVGTDDFPISETVCDPDGVWCNAQWADAAYNSTDDEYLVVWTGTVGYDAVREDYIHEVYGQRIDAATGSEVSSDFRISFTAPTDSAATSGTYPAVAYNSGLNQYIVVWVSDDTTLLSGGEREIVGQILNADGTADGGNFRISNMGPDGVTQYTVYQPDTAYDSSSGNYLVVWDGNNYYYYDEVEWESYSERDVWGQLIDPDGAEVGSDFRISDMGPSAEVGEPTPAELSAYVGSMAALAYDPINTQFLVVWQGDDNTGSLVDGEFEIFGQGVDSDGTLVGANFRISDMGPDGNTSYRGSWPMVAFNGTDEEFFVVWHGDDTTGTLVQYEYEIFGQRITASTGAEVGMNDARLTHLGTDGDAAVDAERADVVYGDGAYMITFASSASSPRQVSGQLVTNLGVADGDDFDVSSNAGSGAYEPRIEYSTTSGEYLFVWRGSDAGDVGNEVYGQRYSTAPLPEPTNQATGFNAAADSVSQITTTWTDATGDQLPGAYLLMCSTTDSFTPPVDGTEQSDDSDCSDGAGVVNIAQGTQTYAWTGLSASTQYYYTMYAYTNSGTEIDYKTDGTVPTGNATTDSAPPILTGMSPSRNTMGAAVDSNVVLTYSENINAATATSDTIVLHSPMQGKIEATYDATNNVVTLNPSQNFFGGEWVTAIATTSVEDTTGKSPDDSTQWQFLSNTFISRTFGRFSVMYDANSAVSGNAVWADFNNDGWLDYFVQGIDPSDAMTSNLVLNDGDGTFTSAGVVTNMYMGSQIAPGDYDNDGDVDLLMATANMDTPGLVLYQNDGSGGFSEVAGTPFPTASFTAVFCGAAWGDYNNDGWLDLLITRQSLISPVGVFAQLFENNGDGTFTENTGAGITGVAAAEIAWGDYDNDGWLDVVIQGKDASSVPYMKPWHNEGDGTFVENTSAGFTDMWGGSVAWGDFDGDGWLDLLTTGQDASNNRLTFIYQNDQDGTFTDISAGLTGTSTGNAAWGDYDNDGDLDIILTGRDTQTSRVMELYENDSGTFTKQDYHMVESSDGMAIWGDYDNDGDVDLLRTGRGNTKPDESYERLAIIYRNDNHPIPEPADYPSSFTATASGSEITTTWADATSDLHPDGYVVMCSTSDSFTAPVDGTPQSDDSNCADGSGVMNVLQWNETYTWTGLSGSTTYYFTAYSYNNTGAAIDYKVDGTPPTANDTTDAVPPTATTNAATSVGVTGATLNGTVNAQNDSTTVSFEYGTDTGYGTTVAAAQSPLSSSSDQSVSKAITGLTPNTTYHYRVTATNSADTTNGDDQTFTTDPLGAPTLTSPENASAIHDTTPTFDWEDADGATGYVLQYSTEDTFSSPVEETVSSSTFTPVSALEYRTYYWRVKSTLGATESGWSSEWSFTVASVAQPTFPKNDYVILVGTTTFKWGEASNATGYEVELYHPDGGLYDMFKLGTDICSAGLCEYKLPYKLDEEYGIWKWRVKGTFGVDGGTWSDDATFDYTQLTQIGAQGPVDKAVVDQARPTFTWDASDQNVFAYDFEIWALDGTLAFQETFKPVDVCSGDTCSWTATSDLAEGTYTWRVLAKKYPNNSGWFESMVFTVDTVGGASSWNGLDAGTAFSAPQPRFPKNEYVITVGTSLIKWTAVSGASSYVLELYRPSGEWFDAWEVPDSACGAALCEFKLPYKLDTEFGNWQWRVRAKDGDSLGTWSGYATFVYEKAAPISLYGPVGGLDVSTTTPTFTWEDSSQNMFKYVIEVWTADGTMQVTETLDPGDICSSGTCTWTSTTTLTAGEEYKWRVLGKKWPNTTGWTETAFFDIVID